MNGRCANCRFRLATLRTSMDGVGQRDLCAICFRSLSDIGMDLRPADQRPAWLRRSLAKDLTGGAA